MNCIDTSVIVAGFSAWHSDHKAAMAILAKRPSVPSHALIEAYSVLTRLPAPYRAPGDVVVEYLERVFADRVVGGIGDFGLLAELAEHAIVGGAVYDAYIAHTVRTAGLVLVTLDVRAVPTYRALGADLQLLAS